MAKQKKTKKPGRLGLYYKRLTSDEQAAQREAAFDAIRRLYAEALPLWLLPARHLPAPQDVRG